MHSLCSQGYLLTPGLSSCAPQVLGYRCMLPSIPGLCSAGGSDQDFMCANQYSTKLSHVLGTPTHLFFMEINKLI